MLTKGPGGTGGSGDGVASSPIIDGFLNTFAVPGTSSHATPANNNNNISDMDNFLGFTTTSSIGDPISTLRPQLKDMELRRRARNNAILAKIQELEANACVQAARSERLRMMREEYESLVRKYASSQKSHWGTASNGHLNENNNNGFPPSRYLQPFNSSQQRQPYIYLTEPSPPPTQQLLLSTPNTHPFTSTAHPTRDIPSNINRTFATTGINTDITGPVKPVVGFGDDNANDLQQVLNLKKKKVTTIIKSSGSQTEDVAPRETVLPHQEIEAEAAAQREHLQTALFPSSVPSVYEVGANQDAIVVDEREDEKNALLLKEKKTVSNKVEMMLMMLDEEDDESSYQEEKRRKQQFENLHQQLHQPKAHLEDDTNSISSPPSTSVVDAVSTSNATEKVGFKQRQRQKQLEKVMAEREKKYQKKRNNEDETKDETSQDTTTISLANNNQERNRNKRVVAADASELSEKILLQEDISLSDSTSAFQVHKNENQRKKLLEQLVTSSTKNSNVKNKRTSERISGHDGGGGGDTRGDHEENSGHDESSDEGNKDGSVMKSENKERGVDDIQACSSPTAGATSESIGDSMMDSIQKTPDALLPRDDSELHEIAEAKEKEHAVSPDTKNLGSGDDGGSSNKPFGVQSGVNDKVSVERKMRLKQESPGTQGGRKELEVHERQINDAEEIHPNNLSSSKVDVPAEEEKNFSHANNPGETNTGITPITFQPTFIPSHPTKEEDIVKEGKQEERKNLGVAVHEDVEHAVAKELSSSVEQEKQIVSGDSSSATGMGVNESNKKKSMISHSPAPSANMSAHSSSTTSSFTSGSNAVDNGTNGNAFPPSIPASANLPQRHSSTGSSSTSSSRQHSLDEQGDGNGSAIVNVLQTKEQSNSGSYLGSPQVKAIQQQQHQSPTTLPQSIHKRHQQLQQQVRKEREEKETTPPVGADVMPERLSSSSDSFSSKAPALETAQAATTNNAVDVNNGRKVSPSERGTISIKSTKGTVAASPLTSSPTTKKAGTTNSGNSNGNNVSGNGAGIRAASGSRSSKNAGLMMKQGQSSNTGTAVTIPSGPTGALNTARRVRLKLHEDSDTDSSEIGSVVKSQPAALLKGAGTGHQPHSINSNNSNVKTAGELHDGSGKSTQDKKHTDGDDDFDDFYDNF